MTEVGTSATMPGPRHGMITLNLAMFMSNIAYMPQHECQVWICHQWVLGSGAASDLLFELNEIATGMQMQQTWDGRLSSYSVQRTRGDSRWVDGVGAFCERRRALMQRFIDAVFEQAQLFFRLKICSESSPGSKLGFRAATETIELGVFCPCAT